MGVLCPWEGGAASCVSPAAHDRATDSQAGGSCAVGDGREVTGLALRGLEPFTSRSMCWTIGRRHGISLHHREAQKRCMEEYSLSVVLTKNSRHQQQLLP